MRYVRIPLTVLAATVCGAVVCAGVIGLFAAGPGIAIVVGAYAAVLAVPIGVVLAIVVTVATVAVAGLTRCLLWCSEWRLRQAGWR
jgi:hypothetical protein